MINPEQPEQTQEQKKRRTIALNTVEKLLLLSTWILIILVIGLSWITTARNQQIEDINDITHKIDAAASETQRIVHEFEERAIASQACQPNSTTPTTTGQCQNAVGGAAINEGLQSIKRMEATLNELKTQLEEQQKENQ